MPEEQKKPVDTEIKFISTANTQIKFYNRNLQVDAFKKIEKLLLALGIQIDEKTSSLREKSTTRDDTYFDDDWHLADNGCSLSIRSYNEKREQDSSPDVLMFKYDGIKGHSNGIAALTRRELKVRLCEGMKETFCRDGISREELQKLFSNADLPIDQDVVFKKQGGARIRRSYYIISVNSQQYRLSIDRYYFFDREQDKYSETFTEIELDNRTDTEVFDPKIQQVAEILQAMFEIRNQAIAKYTRFKEFIVADDFREYYFIGFDLVSYSTGQSWMQKQIVQLFHKTIKDQVLRTGFSAKNELTKISIGDGAVIAAKVNWTNIVRLLTKIRTAVEEHNHEHSDKQIEYRTAIHYGPVFRFTDLNDMINVAGNGINIVNRILSEVNEGEVVLSREAYDRIIDGAPTNANQFRLLGEKTVKHGVVIHLYQFLDTETNG